MIVSAACCLAVATSSAWDRGDLKDYHARRANLISGTGDGVVVLFGYNDADVAASVTRFRQNEQFYYLTGWNEPGAILMLVPKAGGTDQPAELGQEILYLPARNLQLEKWNGPKLGPESPNATTETGFAAVHSTGLFQSELLEALKRFPKIYTELTPQPESGEESFQIDEVAKLKAIAPVAAFADLRPAVQSMRAIKSPAELTLIRKAVENSVDAHLAAMKAMKPGAFEYEVSALLKFEWERRGSEWASYPPIVGSGFYSTVLHYDVDERQMQDGDLVVIDAAGSYGGYASDITRTLPAGRRFAARQREIYEIVRGAQAAAIAAAKPGIMLGRGPNGLHQIALDYINAHGKDLHGQPLGKYFIHGLGHSVGLNVHDPMEATRLLQPGMVVTIEPGIYIPEEKIGVRIEDMILITRDGCEVLSRRLTSDPAQVEAIMAGK
jgi:Xaa-Pro aminopeptidase